MHIDAHQHFWRYDPREYGWIDDSMDVLRRDFLPEDLKPELDRNGFQGCIAVQARQTLEETRWLLELADRNSFIAGVAGWVDLRSPDVRHQLKSFMGSPKFVGVRHIVQSEPDGFLLQPSFLRGMSVVEEAGLAYDILIYARQLPEAIEFVSRFERQRFVLDHLGKPEIKSRELASWSRGIRQLASFPNVFCKLSGLVTEADWRSWKAKDFTPYLDVAFEHFGPARLMIGSDWPVSTLAGDYPGVMSIVQDYVAKFSAEAQVAVFGESAQKCYQLANGVNAGFGRR